MDPVVHFEMPAENKKRVSDFYTKVFRWNMKELGPEMGDYLLAHTTKTDENNMIKKPGTINGGFFKKGKDGKIPHIVISVKNLDNSIKLVKKEGGKIHGKPMDIPGVGKFVSIIDSEGNRVGMLQPLMK